MLKTLIAAAAALTAMGASAQAAEVKRIGPADSFIAQAVIVPPGSTTAYVSGITPRPMNADAPKGTPPVFGDTKTQATSIFTQMQAILTAQGMTMGDVVMMRVYLAADPAKDGKMDFAGLNDAYKQFFGAPDQPNKPARATFQVAALVSPAFLVEIEAQAAKAPAMKAKKSK